jgi:hypothetical protein
MNRRRSPIEIAALEWARLRIKLRSSDDADGALELLPREREATARLLAVCTEELAKDGIAVIDLEPSALPPALTRRPETICDSSEAAQPNEVHRES